MTKSPSPAHKADPFQRALQRLLRELFDGPPGELAFILNQGDPGLLRQLEGITAAAASQSAVPGGSTIAAHTDHVAFGLELLNRWAAGESDPWSGADWNASWRRRTVNDAEWRALTARIRRAADEWSAAIVARHDWDGTSATNALSSLAHTGYHVGAIRQLLTVARGRPASREQG